MHREVEPLPPLDPATSGDLGESDPESQGVDARALVRLARAIDESHEPVFSFLISRHGKIVFEMYTSRIGRDDAHYMMSVTKSFTSALVGIAIDSHLVAGDDIPVSQALPPAAFANPETRTKFDRVTVKDALAMSALDAPVYPHLGLLYLHHGMWQGKRILSQAWIEKSFTPWIKSEETPHDTDGPNYGYYWWTQWLGTWTAHVANGFRCACREHDGRCRARADARFDSRKFHAARGNG